MHLVFIEIYFLVGAIRYWSISETITSMEYVKMFFTRQYQELGISLTLLQGAYNFLWLENTALIGKKVGVREHFEGGMAKNYFELNSY